MSESGNTTMNETQSSSCPSNPTAEKIGITFVFCLIFILSSAGNTVIGVIVYKTKTMRKPINFFIVSMAMSDLLLPIFGIPQLIQVVDSRLISGPLRKALCKLGFGLSTTSSAVSIQSLVLIGVDRFGAVVFPLRSPLISSKMCPFFILASWIVAIAVSSPGLFHYKVVEYPEKLVCYGCLIEVFRGSSFYCYYFMSFIVIFTLIPFVLIAMLYITIYLKLKSQKIPGEQSANAGQQRQQRERNVLKMSIAIVIGFAICWLPIAIFWINRLSKDTITCPICDVPYYVVIVNFLYLTSCTINSYICLILCRNYRNGFKALLRYTCTLF